MLGLEEHDLRVAEALAGLSYCNPFLGERIELERRVLGDEFEPFFPVWHPRADVDDNNPNVVRIAERAEHLAERMREHLSRSPGSPAEHELYHGVLFYVLYDRYQSRFYERIVGKGDARAAPFFPAFLEDLERLTLPSPLPEGQTPEHLFATFFQVRRAFYYTFHSIAGSSMPAARLRAQVWHSVFTHDGRRYQRALYRRMGEVTTLITGPSGAGKELVARAIGLARYIPFDRGTGTFREGYDESFFPLNLAALSPTLIESELFGHRKGSFTGAVADRQGWLEVCPPLGTVFLDEIGEVDPTIQVKLLRVLETRTFERLGSTDTRTFRGKVIAATNRDLALEIRQSRFREDLYYRLCADRIVAPSLRDRIRDSEGELPSLLTVLAQRLAGEDEAPALALEAEDWIDRNLGRDYPWPGNVRELAQCVSNVMIRGDYRPAARERADARDDLAGRFSAGSLSAEEMLAAYCTIVFEQAGSYVKAAERLGLDRRTVRAKVDRELLENLRSRR